LIGQGPATEVIVVLIFALIGVWFISSALQGYVSFIGTLGSGVTSMIMRFLLFFAGLLVAAPTGGIAGLGHMTLTVAGLALALLPLGFAWRRESLPA
jgi:hypothetical protein